MNELSQPRTKNILPVISFVTFIGFLDTHLLIPVMALYAYELGAGIGIVGLIIGLYSIINTPANVFLGRLVDRIGYRLPLVAGLIGDAVSMFLYTLCRMPFHLALVRLLHGMSGGMVGPSTMSAIVHHGGEERRGRAMAVYGMSMGAATLVGYGLSGFIASRFGFKVVFWLGGALLVMGAALALWLPGSGRRDTTGLKKSPGGGWQKVKELLRRRGLISPYCTIFAQYFSFGGVVTLLPLYLKDRGMEAFHVGILLAVFAVLFIILQMPVGNLSDRIGRAGLIKTGLALGIVSLVLLPWMTVFPLLIVVMALYGAAYGMIFPSVSAMVADHTAAEERGLGTGIFHALLTAGVAIGAPVIGWAGGVVGVERGLILSAGVMVLTLIVTLVALRR
ncbi:MAG: MFS transporter [Dehalococcoidales bacterium]|nr:MFS transporter [Dehalococcoidales bacterium]